jgi:hypothetical protein
VTTIPSVTVNSSNLNDEGVYIVTLGSKLFNESTIDPSYIVFEVYLHASSCIETKLLPTSGAWVKCADLNDSCSCNGLVRYGKDNSWT